MRYLVPALALTVCAVVNPVFAADFARERNKGARLTVVGLPTSCEADLSQGGDTATKSAKVGSAIRVAASFDFFTPKHSVVGFHLGVGSAFSSFDTTDPDDTTKWKRPHSLYGILAEPGISIHAVDGFRIEIGIPIGGGVGTTQYKEMSSSSSGYYSITTETTTTEPVFYWETGFLVRPTYTFPFGLELLAQLGYQRLAASSSHTWISGAKRTETSTLSGFTWGIGAGYRF